MDRRALRRTPNYRMNSKTVSDSSYERPRGPPNSAGDMVAAYTLFVTDHRRDLLWLWCFELRQYRFWGSPIQGAIDVRPESLLILVF